MIHALENDNMIGSWRLKNPPKVRKNKQETKQNDTNLFTFLITLSKYKIAVFCFNQKTSRQSLHWSKTSLKGAKKLWEKEGLDMKSLL